MALGQTSQRHLILGIDPGYDRCGWSVLAAVGNKMKPVSWGCWETDRKATKEERFAQLWRSLQELCAQTPITEIAMESLFFSRNVSTALPVSEVRGMVYALAFLQGVKIHEYRPSAIKIAVTGYGKADKNQVMQMVLQLLKLEKIPNLDDTGDALAVAITHAQTLTMNEKIEKAEKQP